MISLTFFRSTSILTFFLNSVSISYVYLPLGKVEDAAELPSRYLPSTDVQRARQAKLPGRAALEAAIKTKTRDEWAEIFFDSDACVAPILTFEEASQHPHMAARGVYFERGGLLEASPAPRFDGVALPPGRVPAPGEHTEEVLAALQRGAGQVWLPDARDFRAGPG